MRASEQRFRDFAAASSDWFWEVDAGLRFCWFSDTTAALSGISPERMLGRTRRELGEGVGDEGTLDTHMAELRAHRPFRNFRYRTRSDSSTVVWLSVSGLPVFDASGLFQGYRGTGCNVTAEVLAGQRAEEAQQRLAESEERFRIAFQMFADALSISRLRDGLYVDVNDAFARLFGYRKDEVVGRTSLDLGMWEPAEERDRFVGRPTTEQNIRDAVLHHRRRDGEMRTVLVSARHCLLAGEPHILASLRDITELQRRTLSRAVEQSSVAVMITDAEGRIEYVNPCFTEVTGYADAEVRGARPSLLKSGLTPGSAYRRLWETISQGEDWQGELCNRRKDGSLFWSVVSISPVKDDAGRVTNFIGIEADISESKRVEHTLRASEERFRSLVETSLFGICIERDGKPLFVNQTVADIFGYQDAAELMALGTLDALYPQGERQRLAQVLERSANGHSPSQHEIRGIRKDGSVIWLHTQIRIVPWVDGTALQSTMIDVTLRKRYEDRLQYQANFDPVTDLPNRSLALDRLGGAIEAARRRATRVSVLFIDVDHFKKINDSIGHAAGDRFLRQLAQRLKTSIRQMDTVARLGGDEFVIILGEVRLRDDAEAVAAKITETCARPFLLDGQELFVTLSVGVAAFPEDGDDAEALLNHADAAMYVGKQNGRGQVRFFTPELRQRSHNRIRQEIALRHALERGELALHYQPLIEIRTGEVVGAEALLRWIDPEHGKTSSDTFVRLAEDTGLIVPIGEWVLATGCRELRRWIDAGHTHLGLSINVSGRQFRGGSLPAAVRGTLREYRLDPQALTLEITESLLTEDPGEFKPTMDRLVTEGVRLAVDDFGTGYASLSYLNRVPLDSLKIDRSYTGGMLDDAGRSTLVDALIILAHRLYLRVVAEGVETAGQLDFLRAHGCDLAQGYFFSAPLPADDFLQLLDRRRAVAAVAS